RAQIGRFGQRKKAWYGQRLWSRLNSDVSNQRGGAKAFGTVHAQSIYERATSRQYVRNLEWNDKLASNHQFEMAFPFLDRELISFLMGIPGEFQVWRGVPKGILREALRGILPDAICDRTWKADYTNLANKQMTHDVTHVMHTLRSDGIAARL